MAWFGDVRGAVGGSEAAVQCACDLLQVGPMEGAKTSHIAPEVNSPVETSALRAADGDAISKLREVSKLTGATLLDPFPDVCGAEYCSPFFDDGKPKFSDGMHLRPVFVRKQIQIFDNLLMVQ
jgi:hypothetical protein